MEASRLEMTFKNEADTTMKISVDNPRADITDLEVKAAMDNIVAKNIFNSTGGNLVAVAGARIVSTNIQELNVVG